MAQDRHNQANKQPQKDLVKKGSSLASLIDNAYIVIGLDGDIHEANEAAQHLLGLTQDALIGHDFFSRWIVPNMGNALVDQVISDRLVRGYITDMKRANGETFIASINAQLVINQEDYSKVIECLVTDITVDEKKKDEFAETLRSVTGGIAHLINNQMASVVGTADLVKMELADRPELAAKLDRISASGMQASDVAHNLVDFADTSDNLTLDEVHLEDVIKEVEAYYKAELAADKPRRLTIRTHKKLHRLFANHESIVKMLKYLVHNAVDATKEGGDILISSKNVVLLNKKTGLNKKYVLVAVEDHGHGMDAATQQKIFEPFFSTRFAGRGMSLPQVLKIIKKHNGQIRIKTGVGKGSIFKVYLPALD
ncbi:MAG TPA: PAS domain-containing sensor histidine kinase [Mariprofundaceae bacterium]|nr:PAS domain-containing sensor histidine kinase [Mariprofundaceae bacterium]